MIDIPCYKHPYCDFDFSSLEKLQNNNIDFMAILSDKLSQIFNNKKIMLTNSYTSANHLALRALNTKRGDKVICSVNSFVNTPQAIRYFDSEPIFVDVNKDDFNIDLNALEHTLKTYNSKKLKAMFVNHIAGQPSDLDEIKKLCEQYNINVINDCGFTLGLTYKGKLVGDDEIISSFSFTPYYKNPFFSGSFLVINDELIYKKAKELSNYAISETSFKDNGNLSYFYDVNDVGLDYSMSQIDAAFALNLLNKYQEYIQARQKIAKAYDEVISQCKHVSAPTNKGEHIYSRYIVKIDKNRDAFARALQEKGIQTGLHYVPIHLLSYYKNKYNLKINDFPNALSNYQQMLSLPMYPLMSEDDINRVCEAILEVDNASV